MNNMNTNKEGMKSSDKKWNPAKENEYSQSETTDSRFNQKGNSKTDLEIKPGMMVYAKGTSKDTAGRQLATVDHLDGDSFIKLTRNGSADEKHHWISKSWVERVDAKGVYLSKSEEEFTRGLQNELPKDSDSGNSFGKEKMAI